MDAVSFTEAELRAVDELGHRPWLDGFCQCWPDSEFTSDAHPFNMDHIIEVMKRQRGEA